MKLFIFSIISLFMFSCDENRPTVYQSKGIIKNINCNDNWVNGRGCVSVAKYIDGPYRGQTCNNNKLAGAVGDTIQISITNYRNNMTFCEMR